MLIIVRVPIVSAVIVSDGRFLLGYRSARKSVFPSTWDFLGGHVEEFETPRDAVVRECLEEAGIVIEEFFEYSTSLVFDDMVLSCFCITKFSGEPINSSPNEHDELRWFTFAEAKELNLAIPEMLEEFDTQGRFTGIEIPLDDNV
jgi:8-oxo-dGTP pyrophosphatase MutT (NUDIX family)